MLCFLSATSPIGSISTAFSSPVYVPHLQGRSTGSSPKQQLFFSLLFVDSKQISKQVCLLCHQGELKDRAQQARAAELDLDNRNGALLKEEEAQFQEYANKVIAEAKAHDRNPYPLIKAAREGPGGGRGPKFDGKQGLRPSFLVCDGTGVQLPNYSNGTEQGSHTKIYGNPDHSRKRLGFTW